MGLVDGKGGLINWIVRGLLGTQLLMRNELIQEGTWPPLYVAMLSARPPL